MRFEKFLLDDYLQTKEGKELMEKAEMKLASCAASFLGKQMEQ